MSPRRRIRRPVPVALLACAGALAHLAGCGAQEPAAPPEAFVRARPSGLRVLLVGIDGATFQVLSPLIREGRLPTLARLVREGSAAPLLSLEPSRSPAIWTTVATGVLPERHGIDDFTREGGGLVSSRDRRRLAIWNLTGAFGLATDAVGWWVTWPAERITGRIVSDRVAHTRWEAWTRERAERHLTSPPGLIDELRGLVVDPLDPPLEEIEALVELREAERRELLAAREPIPFHWPSVLKFGWCEQRSIEAIALHLLARRQPDLALVFLIAVDPVSHTTWHFYEPAAFDGVDAAEAERVGGLIPRLYEHDDAVLARLLASVADDTVVLVVSDHGFRASGELPAATDRVDLRPMGIERERPLERPVNVGMTGVHAREGVLVAAGGPIVRGARFETPPTVADVAPTLLALLGLPVAEDMDGRVLHELLSPEFLARHPVRTIPSYEGLVPRPPAPETEDEDALRRRYLEALGYLEAEGG